jgi:pyruvate-formate lyase-activating enzyme
MMGSVIDKGSSENDLDLFVPSYNKYPHEIKGYLPFIRKLYKKLGYFPVHPLTFKSLGLKKGQKPIFWRRKEALKIDA